MIDLSPATGEETLETRNMCVAAHVCTCVRVSKACFCKSVAGACERVRVLVLSDWWSEAHTHHQQGICEVCESGAVIPLSLPKQRPRLLIYSKSLKSAYYCCSSSRSPSLCPHNLPLPPKTYHTAAAIHREYHLTIPMMLIHAERWSAASGTSNPFLTHVWK